MKGIIVLLSLLVFCLDVEAKSPGKSGATFLKIGIGAKPISMGEAFSARGDDLSAIYYNPAGLASFENKTLSFTHIAWFEKINYEYLIYLYPLAESGIKIPGVFASSISYLGINDIKEYNSNGDYIGRFKASDMLFNLAYARKIKPHISFGLNLKLISQKIKSSSTALAVDIGCLYKTRIKNLTTGLTFQNIALFNNFIDDLPYNIKLGSCFRLLDNVTLSMDVDLPNDNTPKLHLGMEYLCPEIEDIDIAIRAGYKTGIDASKLSFGFGVGFDKYKLDYAYSSYNDLGDIHQVSFEMKFDKSQKSSEAYYQKSPEQIVTPTIKEKEMVMEESEEEIPLSIKREEKIVKEEVKEKEETPLPKQIITPAIKEKEMVIEESEEEIPLFIKREEKIVKEEVEEKEETPLPKQIITPAIKEKEMVIKESEEGISLSIKREEKIVKEEVEEKEETPSLVDKSDDKNLQETVNTLRNYSKAKVTLKEE